MPARTVGSTVLVNTRGLRRDIRKFLAVEERKILRSAALDAAEEVADTAANEAPFRTGRLRDSIKASASKTGASATVRAGTKVRVPYAGVIHWGWPARGIEPNEFITRALDMRAAEIRRQFDRATIAISARLSSRRTRI